MFWIFLQHMWNFILWWRRKSLFFIFFTIFLFFYFLQYFYFLFPAVSISFILFKSGGAETTFFYCFCYIITPVLNQKMLMFRYHSFLTVSLFNWILLLFTSGSWKQRSWKRPNLFDLSNCTVWKNGSQRY